MLHVNNKDLLHVLYLVFLPKAAELFYSKLNLTANGQCCASIVKESDRGKGFSKHHSVAKIGLNICYPKLPLNEQKNLKMHKNKGTKQ